MYPDQSLYPADSVPAGDMAGNPHVLSVGIDFAPALEANAEHAAEVTESIAAACLKKGGEAAIPRNAVKALTAVAKILNIAWIEEALGLPARIICPRSSRCPRLQRCEGAVPSHAREVTDIRAEILEQV
jgi:hypothetical protein